MGDRFRRRSLFLSLLEFVSPSLPRLHAPAFPFFTPPVLQSSEVVVFLVRVVLLRDVSLSEAASAPAAARFHPRVTPLSLSFHSRHLSPSFFPLRRSPSLSGAS